MKKDKEWLKEQFTYYREAVGQTFNDVSRGMNYAYDNVEKIIDQLEEPEIEEELWKDIEGYEGLYQVSSSGRVKRVKSGRILKPGLNQKGYEIVSLSKNNTKSMKRVNRLVAQHFIPNEHNLPQVNHIDENKRNNKVSNLEWVTSHQNANYGNRNRKLANVNNKPVMGINLRTGEKIIFSSTQSTVQFGFNFQNVAQVARGERNSHKGYTWEYVEIDMGRQLLDMSFTAEVTE